MEFLFGKKKTPEEMLKQNQRALNRAMRLVQEMLSCAFSCTFFYQLKTTLGSYYVFYDKTHWHSVWGLFIKC